MKYKEWLTIPIDISQVLYNSSLDNIDKKNYNLKDDGFIPEPIGISINIDKKDLHIINNCINENDINKNLMYYTFSTRTDKKRTSGESRDLPLFNRENVKKNLENNGFSYKGSRGIAYLKNMCLAKFAPSPEGNGIDCHRHWEALYCKCIPIVEDNEKIKPKFEKLPVIYTKDYSEITEEFLNKKYEEILETEYDFSKLYLYGYSEEEIERIKVRSKYWCVKLKRDIFYD